MSAHGPYDVDTREPACVRLPAPYGGGCELRVSTEEDSSVVLGAIGGPVALANAEAETFCAREFPLVGLQWYARSDAAVALGLYDGPSPFDGNLYMARAFSAVDTREAYGVTLDDMVAWVGELNASYSVAVVRYT